MKTGETSQPFLAAFDKRGQATGPDYGNTQGAFVEQFRELAAFIYAGGSEGMEAARLEGRETMKLRVRSNANTVAIKTDWQVRHIETGTVFAVKSIDAITQRGWVWLRVQSGVAA